MIKDQGTDGTHGEVLECDVCILGAGIAGLNALFAASRQRTSSCRIVLVDRQAEPAGMWHGAYDYVRLHQPHPIFTAGNIAWRGQSDRYHLAHRREVVDHLKYCYQVLKERTRLEARFGHEYLEHEDSERGAHPVTIHCRRLTDGASLTIRARHLIKAFGYNVKPMSPLEVTSDAVLSLSPDRSDIFDAQVEQSTGPVYVVGGGKTGMDTAHALIRAMPNKRVRMLIGAGTMFLNRDLSAPRGLRRHFGGATTLDAFVDVAGRFDGRNEVEVMAHFRRTYGVSLHDDCRRFLFGLMSPEENREIRRGLDEVIRDHLEDVVDGPSGPVMVLRRGGRRPIAPGSVLINATGYLAREKAPYEPYLSASANVLSIQPTSTTHFLSSQASYFLSHLFLRGDLASLPLYETDVRELHDASRDVLPAVGIVMTVHNTTLIMGRLPRWAAKENGLDPMLMLPLHRRLRSFVGLMRFVKSRPDHMAKALDTVRERFGIRLGPLAHLRPPSKITRAAS
ncbi:MAG: FAD-dependent oxidoreductase [Myxococcales bacterium]|nr:FAD-dependent oxidoreductase [Myxococcales bacterium]